MIKITNPLISSLSQSILDCVETILEEFKSIEPSFNYRLSFATDYDEELPKDVFDIVLQVGNIDRLPTHYTQIGEKESLLFAGIVDVGLFVVNPISVAYTNNIPLTQIAYKEINDNYYDTEESNYMKGETYDEITKETHSKIQNDTRILEALSMFMYRKGMISNNFELTFTTNMPSITGELDYGVYRLTEELFIRCKFQELGDFYISSGENVRAQFNIGDNWVEFYNIVDFSFGFSSVDQTYPVSPRPIVRNQINQLESKLTISSPAIINIGANKYFSECFEKGEIEKIQNLEMRYTDDNKIWKKTKVNINSLEYPRNVDTFGSFVYTASIVEPIEVE